MSNKKKDALFKPPERFVLLAFGHDVVFPGEQLSITASNESCRERAIRDGYAVVISIFPEEDRSGDTPPFGVLAAVSEDPDATGASVVLHLISRVRVLDPREFLETEDGMIFDCRIEHVTREAISEETWRAARKDIGVFTQKFVRFGFATQILFGKVFAAVISPDVREKMSQGFADIAIFSERADRESVHDVPNMVGGLVGFFLRRFADMGVIPRGTWLKYSRELRAVLFERATMTQLMLLGRLMDEFARDMTFIARRKPQAKKKSNAPVNEHPDDASLPEEVRKIIQELSPQAEQGTADGSIHRTYIGWLRKIPWGKKTVDNKELTDVRRILDEDHYGLERVKEVILDFLAVRRVKPDAKSQILCFVGPPGVGKTSICKSIARGMGRKYVRTALGGLRDEAEIRGHRRTYIGALPGRIIQGLERAGSMTPVFVLDEIDKLSKDFHGDPGAALMEVLDPEQNKAFVDNYLEVPIDLSEVLFIATANTTATIPAPLLDRMEVIELPGYTDDEKVRIAETNIVSKENKECGIDPEHPENMRNEGLPVIDVRYTRPALEKIASDYTKDVGMREQSRAIAKIGRKIVRKLQEGGVEAIEREYGNGNGHDESAVPPVNDARIITITPRKLKKLLGKANPHTPLQDVLAAPPPGVAPTLMVYEDGQGVLGCVEANFDRRSSLQLHCTGKLQQVIKESMHVAVTRLFHTGGLLAKWPHNIFIHVHCDEAAIPKDGPSAGVLIYLAVYSAVMRVPLKRFFSVTGETTMVRDAVLPVGGVKSKLLAALKGGIREVAIPLSTQDQLDDLSRDGVHIVKPADLGGQSWRDVSRGEREPGTLTVYCIEKPQDALEIAFPNNYPPPEEPPQEWMVEFAKMPTVD